MYAFKYISMIALAAYSGAKIGSGVVTILTAGRRVRAAEEFVDATLRSCRNQ